MRGTVARAEIRRVLAATYHQVWWPSTDTVKFNGGQLPVWDEATGNYLDPATGEVLPTWAQALDAIGPRGEPWHAARFGERFDAQGVLAGSKDANRCIGYLTKYLTKQVGDCHHADTDAERAHAARLAEALRFQPCSPTCANWLRYGVQPKNARPGLVPGHCKGKAHMMARLRDLPADHLLTMQEAAEWLRVSKRSVYSLIHANQLRTIKIGRRRLVSREALNECVKQLAKGAA
jgi:excisionase family DNA binding protein